MVAKVSDKFVSYTVSKELTEMGAVSCGFGWFYTLNGKDYVFTQHIDIIDEAYEVLPHWAIGAFTYDEVFEFFRDKYKLSGTPQYFTGGFYCYTINDMKDTTQSNRLFTEFETYKQASDACITKLIEIVKSKDLT